MRLLKEAGELGIVPPGEVTLFGVLGERGTVFTDNVRLSIIGAEELGIVYFPARGKVPSTGFDFDALDEPMIFSPKYLLRKSDSLTFVLHHFP